MNYNDNSEYPLDIRTDREVRLNSVTLVMLSEKIARSTLFYLTFAKISTVKDKNLLPWGGF